MFCQKAIIIASMLMFFLPAGWILAQEAEVVKLPAAQMTGGRPLMDCLKARQSVREFGPDKIMVAIDADANEACPSGREVYNALRVAEHNQ